MEFGSEEIFELIAQNIESPGEYEWYGKLAKCIERDTRKRLGGYALSAADKDDIVQDVQIKVFTNLSDFYSSSTDASVGQRNSWLTKIIMNTANDVYRKLKDMGPPPISIDGDANFGDIPSSEDMEDTVYFRSRLFAVFSYLGTINTTPEKIMSYLFNKLESLFYEKSGKPSDIERHLYGRPMNEVFDELIRQMSLLFNSELPKDVVQPLWERVEPVGAQPYTRKAADISSDTHWIQGKVKNHSSET